MKKLLKGLALLALITGLGLFISVKMIEQTYWEPVSEKHSPDGAFTLYEYNYSSDGNRHAPYGTYIFIKPSYSNKKPINSHVIFAGYCSNSDLYKWVGSTEVEITCIASEKDNVRTQATKAYGINVRANTE